MYLIYRDDSREVVGDTHGHVVPQNTSPKNCQFFLPKFYMLTKYIPNECPCYKAFIKTYRAFFKVKLK